MASLNKCMIIGNLGADPETRYTPNGSTVTEFQIDTIDQMAAVEPNQFNASELMFTLRLYEPFRRWTR